MGPALGAGCAALLHHHLQVSHHSRCVKFHIPLIATYIQEGFELGDEKKDVCRLHGHGRPLGPFPEAEEPRMLNKEGGETFCEKEEGVMPGDCTGREGKEGGGNIILGGEQPSKDSTEKEMQEKMHVEDVVVDQAGEGADVGDEVEFEEEGRRGGGGRKGRERRLGRQSSFSNSTHRFVSNRRNAGQLKNKLGKVASV